MRVLIAEDELDRVEEIRFARAIPAHNDIVACAKGLSDGLLLVGAKTLDDYLWNRRVDEKLNLLILID